MKQICCFNKKRDLRQVAPHLAIDLGECIRNGSIPASASEPKYNDINDPNNVVGRVVDVFQSIEVERAALAAGKAQVAKAKADAAAADSAQITASTGVTGA